ncbi:orotidine-5'-phosphate decarboxylase [Archaeoglobus veneficus]|uniref:Orotidine 5'-phosphate decarboxylase n=1 Tax=Archaeoglobus veneficus (strain DSM 11195 / SNP6) TaxID=693661 RepID=F2KSG2_ARCVS|nr:orotidine-5'-phosphate decarboxylase [Archaeoglobus veneficus]AEA46931.1 orotidine 5'-phosphate decarboxylase [Archaeoglobus veneficus SNP6]
MERRTGIIAALDTTNALNIAREIREYVDAFKVNYPLVLSEGISVVKELSSYGPVIADFKIADVPHISAMIAEIAFENGAKAVITHGFTGSDSVKAVLDVASRYNGEVYVVTELSSAGGQEFMTGVAERIVEMARNLGCHGLIAPATRPERIRKLRELAGNMQILSPGVGAQGGKAAEAIRAGADFVIVGRSIYEGNAVENARLLAEQLKEVI